MLSVKVVFHLSVAKLYMETLVTARRDTYYTFASRGTKHEDLWDNKSTNGRRVT